MYYGCSPVAGVETTHVSSSIKGGACRTSLSIDTSTITKKLGAMPSEPEPDTKHSDQDDDIYELVLPPGIPQKVIIEACKKFNIDVVPAYADVETGLADVTARDLLAFRADKETIEKIRAFIIAETEKFING